jgi:hypothetical protein
VHKGDLSRLSVDESNKRVCIEQKKTDISVCLKPVRKNSSEQLKLRYKAGLLYSYNKEEDVVKRQTFFHGNYTEAGEGNISRVSGLLLRFKKTWKQPEKSLPGSLWRFILTILALVYKE